MDLINKPNLLEKFEELKGSKASVTNVELTKSEINFIYIWMKTAWAYEDALDEALGLTRADRG